VAFRNADTEIDRIQRLVLGWKDELVWPAGFNIDGTVLRADAAADCVTRIDEFLASWMWPFVKVMRYVAASIIIYVH
jgi:hypothetical protein